jgi:hypothetical protein
MDYLPPQPVKTRELLARYQRARRKQALIIASAVFLLLCGGAAVAFMILYVRACQRSVAPEGGGRPGASRRKPSRAEVLAVHDLDPAPWLLAVDAEHLYTAQETGPAASSFPNYPADVLSALPLAGGEPVWKWTQGMELSRLLVSGGRVISLRERLGEPPSVDLATYRVEDGKPSWRITMDGAEQAQPYADDKVLVLSYRKEAAFQLVGINAATGVKAWVVSPRLRAMKVDVSAAGGSALDLSGWGGLCAYSLGNVAGFVSLGTGKLRREYAAPGFIYRLEYDASADRAYLLCALDASHTALIALDLPTGQAVRLATLGAWGDDALLVADRGYVALAMTEQADRGQSRRVMCFAPGQSTPAVDERLEEGVFADLASMSASPGDFFLGVNDSAAQGGKPVGGSRLYRLRCSDGLMWQVKRFDHPILYVLPFKDDCLVLLYGGDVLSCSGAASRVRRLRHAAYPNLEPVQDTAQTHLALYSYPDAHAQGTPGQRGQVIVLR